MSQIIADQTVVSFHYTLTNNESQVLQTSSGGEAMPYLHGAGNIVPGLEEAMGGHAVGDKFSVVVPPEKGYGLRMSPGPQAVPRDQLPEGAEIFPGMPLGAETPDGQHVMLFVTAVDEDQFWVDTDHPLAGVELKFDVEVVAVRAATAQELEHGHPHGPDGHAHH